MENVLNLFQNNQNFQNLNKNNQNPNNYNLNNQKIINQPMNNQYHKNINQMNQNFHKNQINFQPHFPNNFPNNYPPNFRMGPINYNQNHPFINQLNPSFLTPQMQTTFQNYAKNKFDQKNINVNFKSKKNFPNNINSQFPKNKLKSKIIKNDDEEHIPNENIILNKGNDYYLRKKNEKINYNENEFFKKQKHNQREKSKRIKKTFQKKNSYMEKEEKEEKEKKPIKKLRKSISKKFKDKKSLKENVINKKENESLESKEKTESISTLENPIISSSEKPKIDIKDFLILKNKHDKEKLEEEKEKSQNKNLNILTTNNNDKLINNNNIFNTLDNNNKEEKIIPLLNGMCSEREMKEREEQKLLSVFELDPKKTYYDNKTQQIIKKIKPEFAIQAYTRSGGDLNKVDPLDLRTPKALRDTMNYILNEIIDSDKFKNKKFTNLLPIDFKEICLFVIDRFRAIRKNFTILNNMKSNKNCIICHEQIARFLIICLNETIDIKTIKGEQGLYNLNMEQLNLTLTSLSNFYEYSEKQKILEPNNNDIYISPNKEEFLSYFILFSLKQKPIEFMSILSKISYQLRKGKKLSLVLKISKSILTKDAFLFMKILKSKECDYLTSCLMVLFFNEIRFNFMNSISYEKKPNVDEVKHDYLINKMSIKEIIDKLPFEDENEVINFLDWYGINSKGYSPFGIGTDFNNKIDLIKEENYHNYNFLEAPIKTNKRYVQSKMEKKKRKDIVIGKDDYDNEQNNSFITNKTFNEIFDNKSEKDNKSNDNDINKIQKKINEKSNQNNLITSNNSHINFSSSFNINSFDKKNIDDLSISSIKTVSPKKVIKISSQIIKNNYNENIIKYFIQTSFPYIERLIYDKKCRFFSILKYMLEQYKIKLSNLKIFEKRRKHKIFSILRLYSINSKANKEYIKELMNYGKDINLMNTNENIAFRNLKCNYSKTDFSLYNYDDLKYFLIEKYKNDGNKNYINYLQVNIFTEKELIINSQILQNLNINPSLIKSNNNETIIYDSDIYIDKDNSLTLILRFIYLDTLYNLSEYIYYNQKNLNKYTIGIIFIDINDTIYQNSILQNLLTLMKDSLGDYIKKKFIFAFPKDEYNNFSEREIKEQKGFIELINNNYGVDDNYNIIQIGNVKDSSPLYKNIICYENNKSFVELFSNNINIEKFDTRAKFISLIHHNNTIKYQFFRRKIENEFISKVNDNPLIIQLLLGISLFKISSEYYFILFSKFTNKLFNIPFYNSNNEIINYENTLINICTIFSLFNKVYESFIQKSLCLNNYSIMNLFDVFVKEIIDLDILSREQIIIFSNEFKENFYRINIEDNDNINIINLFLDFFNKIILLINQDLNNIVLDCNEDYELYLSIYEKNKNKLFSDVNDILLKTVDLNKRKEYERYMNGKYQSTDNKFLKMKRFRNCDLYEFPNIAIIYNPHSEKIKRKYLVSEKENNHNQITDFSKIYHQTIKYSII